MGWCTLTSMSGRAVTAALAALAMVGLAACSGAESQEPPLPDRPAREGCGPIGYGDVAGRPPPYVEGPLAALPNDHALCRGWWLPSTGSEFVPQGLAVRGRTAWVSGYDHGKGEYGDDTCRIITLDLRSGKELAQVAPISADLTPRVPGNCRHGGGLALGEDGLWLAQRTKLWLLDPDDLSVIRVWHLLDQVWGSYLVIDDQGRVGLGGFHGERRKPLHFFTTDVLLEPGRLDLPPDAAAEVRPGPPAAQGALWADLGPGPAQVWFTRSNTYCGELWAGARRRFAFHPGAEGVAFARGRLWVVSETTAAPYFLQGGRPVVPTLAEYDARRLAGWERSDCGA